MVVYKQGVPDFDRFKILKTGTTSFASPNSIGSSTNISVTHGFNYKPIVFAFVSFTPTGTRFPLPYLSPQLTGDPTPGLISHQVNYEIVVDIITFYWRDITRATNQTAYIRYYFVEERANN